MGQHHIYMVTRSENRMKSGDKLKELKKQVHSLALHTLRACQCLCSPASERCLMFFCLAWSYRAMIPMFHPFCCVGLLVHKGHTGNEASL